ncbi:DNA-formamidopyrimidine glycosylase family protein, partial [Vibrio parahaemolyticus]|uniref:DNA-formamidopyrimidine glycosylase family protein n=1 Tax=Vibrio parahaemolyticus TaxID=670 RepID=UPI0032AF1D33
MPELPEVEVSRMGISPHMVGQTIKAFVFRTPKLRWDIPQELKLLEGQVIRAIHRRAKYLLIETDGLKLDPVSHRVTANDEAVDMGPTEF